MATSILASSAGALIPQQGASASALPNSLTATGPAGGEGPDAVGPDRIHYARAVDVDLFVSPRVAERLQACLVEIERLYAAEPARRATAEIGGAQ